MLEREEIIRILLAVLAMALGIFMFRYAHKVESTDTVQKRFLISKKQVDLSESELALYKKKISKLFNIFACICFVNGVLFAYIPNLVISGTLTIIFWIIGIGIVLVGCWKK